ncbi:MAG: 50S ribosomal protein L10, partial [Clostridia bacterium]|nr:50S ribosomal protein L10 [Clostridia bacterium]
MSANFEAKKEIVSQIKERFEKAQSVVVVHFSGITVEEVTK